MITLNLLGISLFIISSIVSISFLKKPDRWKALFVTSLLFYFLIAGFSLFVLIALSTLVYYFSYLFEHRINIKLLLILILLLPLILSKLLSGVYHFENYTGTTLQAINGLSSQSIFKLIGISYFTFNSISYLIDISRSYITREKNFFRLLLYLIYFPAIFSGPLHRAKYMFEQFKTIEISRHSLTTGCRLILWGLFKNIVIAQRLFIILTDLIDSEISGLYYLLIGFVFYLYIYTNFSSFIDFFQGVSQIFNIRLKDNFGNRIYLAKSRHEFWQGWHITLNEWFRDYFFFVIVKLGGKKRFIDFYLLITFILIALWHELTINLLIWGMLNGLWIIIERRANFKFLRKKYFGIIYHLSISSFVALVFISSNFFETIMNLVFTSLNFPSSFTTEQLINFAIVSLSFIMMDFYYSKAGNERFDEFLEHQSTPIRWFIYLKLIFIILLFGITPGINNYYIQF